MNIIERLSNLFNKFPGIGPRQSKRFVYFLLSQDETFLKELSNLILNIKKEITECSFCSRYFESNKSNLCQICESDSRNKETIIVVSSDQDLEQIEKTNMFNGRFFVLGGTIPILEKNPRKKIKLDKLKSILEKNNEIKEIILALSVNPDGENTTRFLKSFLKPFSEERDIKISTLGRGLSTGTELEYSDEETIKNAFKNRD